MKRNNLSVLICSIWLLSNVVYGLDTAYDKHAVLVISPQIALPIGIKIWFNESGGSVEGLTTWNAGENFASLGIGHFIWHPETSKKASCNAGFPHLLSYIQKRGINLPYWL